MFIVIGNCRNIIIFIVLIKWNICILVCIYVKIYVNNLNLVFILMLFKIIMGFNLSLVL